LSHSAGMRDRSNLTIEACTKAPFKSFVFIHVFSESLGSHASQILDFLLKLPQNTSPKSTYNLVRIGQPRSKILFQVSILPGLNLRVLWDSLRGLSRSVWLRFTLSHNLISPSATGSQPSSKRTSKSHLHSLSLSLQCLIAYYTAVYSPPKRCYFEVSKILNFKRMPLATEPPF
jgi:hypothetical protein